MIDIVYFELAAISLIDIAISIGIQRAIVDVEKTYHLQKKMQTHMKELQEMTKNNAPAEHIAAKNKEISDTMSETMKHQFRATPVLLLVSIPLYFVILPYLFPVSAVNTFPILGFQYHSFQHNEYFIIITFVASMVVQLTLSSRDKKRFEAKAAAAAAADANAAQSSAGNVK